MRGSNINYTNKITGLTPLQIAIQNNMNSKVVKFLLREGANPHVEDKDGKDCCEKAQGNERYEKIKIFKNPECIANPSLRIKLNC